MSLEASEGAIAFGVPRSWRSATLHIRRLFTSPTLAPYHHSLFAAPGNHTSAFASISIFSRCICYHVPHTFAEFRGHDCRDVATAYSAHTTALSPSSFSGVPVVLILRSATRAPSFPVTGSLGTMATFEVVWSPMAT
jgi:hypothetical protein